MANKIDKTELTFEAAVEELEALVRKMEEGGLSLDESLAAFSRGNELAAYCRKKLDAAQLQIEKMESDGRLTAFDPEGEAQ